jgi:hypothetical protein
MISHVLFFTKLGLIWNKLVCALSSSGNKRDMSSLHWKRLQPLWRPMPTTRQTAGRSAGMHPSTLSMHSVAPRMISTMIDELFHDDSEPFHPFPLVLFHDGGKSHINVMSSGGLRSSSARKPSRPIARSLIWRFSMVLGQIPASRFSSRVPVSISLSTLSMSSCAALFRSRS